MFINIFFFTVNVYSSQSVVVFSPRNTLTRCMICCRPDLSVCVNMFKNHFSLFCWVLVTGK